MRIVSRLFRRAEPAWIETPIAPETPFFAIGDIHGEYAAFEALLGLIETRLGGEPVICVGDYVDRGDRSAEVLGWLRRINAEYPERFICLAGNHEDMLLRFLDDPEAAGERWMRHGGLQTLLSYRVPRSADTSLVDLRDRLARAMGDDLIAWLRTLPVSWVSGNVAVVHAGADPSLPIADQPRDTLTWGHRDFAKVPRADGMWVVHGHTIVDDASARNGRISIDTGAYATGRLTAAHVLPDEVRFLSNAD